MYVAFKCFMLQVQTTGVGVHKGGQGRGHRRVEEAQAASGGVETRHRPRAAIVEGARVSLPGGLEETGATPVWKRQDESSEQRGQRI
jgi:hypothetical protein